MPKRSQKKYRRSQLITNITKPYFILVSAVLLVAMVISYSFFIANAEINAERSARSIAQSEAKLAADFIEDLEFLANQVNRQPRITGFFYELYQNRDQGNEFDHNVLKSIDISSALYGMIRDRATDYDICIFNANGDFISSQIYVIDKNAVADGLSVLDFDTAVSEIRNSGGYAVFPPSANEWVTNKSKYVTVRIAMQNELAAEAVAIIEVRGRADKPDFAALLFEIDGAKMDVRHRITEDTLYSVGTFDTSKTAVHAVEPIEGTEWEVDITYSNPVTAAYILRILLIFLAILAVLFGFIFFVTYTIGRSVTRPIMKLAHRVRAINAPDEQINVVDESALDEIRDLERSFDQMLDRVNRSAMQEKKAYSLALQAQMNPHFLYNTLSIIGAAGEDAGAENVSDMCVKLSDMLRYVASYEKITVPLKEEIAHTANYLSLMKSRYEEYFSYSISVDDELLNMAVPKLLVQPLAENCFKHGFKMSPPPWNIDIRLRGTNAHWELVIRDNGVGITDERAAEIRAKIDRAIAEMTLSDIGGVGLVNTIVRLKLTHSKKVDYSITHSGGALIRITVDAE